MPCAFFVAGKSKQEQLHIYFHISLRVLNG